MKPKCKYPSDAMTENSPCWHNDCQRCTLYVDCDDPECIALINPTTLQEHKTALEHWKTTRFAAGAAMEAKMTEQFTKEELAELQNILYAVENTDTGDGCLECACCGYYSTTHQKNCKLKYFVDKIKKLLEETK